MITDPDGVERDGNGRPLHSISLDKQEKVWDFYRRYAVGSKLCPSCLLCGKQVLDQAEWSIQHSELPDIYICKSCVDAARAVPSARGHITELPAEFAALAEFYQVDDMPALIRIQAEHVERLQKKLPPLRGPESDPQNYRQG